MFAQPLRNRASGGGHMQNRIGWMWLVALICLLLSTSCGPV